MNEVTTTASNYEQIIALTPVVRSVRPVDDRLLSKQEITLAAVGGKAINMFLYNGFVTFAGKGHAEERYEIAQWVKKDKRSDAARFQYSGLLSGFIALRDNAKGYFSLGIHAAKGLDSFQTSFNSKTSTYDMYVTWNRTTDAEAETLIRKFGIRFNSKYDPTQLVGYKMQNGNMKAITAIVPLAYAKFALAMEAQGIKPGTVKWEEKEEANRTLWNIFHKHHGINMAISIANGVMSVGVHLTKIASVGRLNEKYASLFMSPKDLAKAESNKAARYQAEQDLKEDVIAIATGVSPEPEIADAVTIYLSPGQGTVVSKDTLRSRIVTIVSDKGVEIVAPMELKNSMYVNAAISMAVGAGGYLNLIPLRVKQEPTTTVSA